MVSMNNKGERKPHIVYVVVHPYSKRDHIRFGAYYMMEKGYDVEIWRIIADKTIKMTLSAGIYTEANYHEYPVDEYITRIREAGNDTLYIFQGKTDVLLRALRYKCRYILMDGFGAIPEPTPPAVNKCVCHNFFETDFTTVFRKAVSGVYFRNLFIRISQYSKAKKWRRLLSDNPPVAVATSTRFAADLYLSPVESARYIIYTHAMDFDRFIEANKEERKRGRHIVYIDTGFFINAYDAVLTKDKTRPYEFAYEFFEQIDRLFTTLENHFNLPVVIAGHPHLNYENVKYGNREIIFNRTCELVRDAVAAVLTTSTAMNFIALYDVPVVKIANSRLKKCNFVGWESAYDFIKKEAEDTCGCGFLDLNDDYAMKHPWDFVKAMDPIKREDYIKKYIIDNDTTDRSVIEYIEEYISINWIGNIS